MGVGPKTRFTAEDTPANVKLDSWKEIAAYLDRDPRTVQLWEKLEGFPIHRLNHNARASVYAYTSEVDAWVRARSAAKAETKIQQPARPPILPASSRPLSIRAAFAAGYTLLGLAILGAIFWSLEQHRAHARVAAHPESVLAVLPFENQTSTDDSLADSLTEGLIADIARLGKIQIVSRNSIMEWKGSRAPVQDVAARLHAALVLRGTVAEAGGEVQATVELLSAPNASHIWGATYHRSSNGAESNSDQIASAIAIDLTRKLTGSAPQVVFPAQSIDARARQLYLTGRFYWNQRTLESIEKAISLYNQALAIDPKYAQAYAGLAESYDLMTDRGVMSDRQAFDHAKAAAERALALDPGLGEAYNAMAFAVYRQDWDFSRADQLFEKAIQLDPASAVAHQWRGEFLGDMMRFNESIAELRKAKELDPLSPMIGADLADGYMHAGRMAEADTELQRVTDLYPDFLPAHLYRITLAVAQGDLARAEAEATAYFNRSGDRNPLNGIQVLRLTASGRSARAGQIENKMLASREGMPMIPYARAQFLFTVGRFDEGYQALDEAYREHSWWLVTMMVDPAFAAVRAQPQFLALAHQVGLPVDPNPPLMARAPQPGL